MCATTGSALKLSSVIFFYQSSQACAEEIFVMQVQLVNP